MHPTDDGFDGRGGKFVEKRHHDSSYESRCSGELNNIRGGIGAGGPEEGSASEVSRRVWRPELGKFLVIILIALVGILVFVGIRHETSAPTRVDTDEYAYVIPDGWHAATKQEWEMAKHYLQQGKPADQGRQTSLVFGPDNGDRIRASAFVEEQAADPTRDLSFYQQQDLASVKHFNLRLKRAPQPTQVGGEPAYVIDFSGSNSRFASVPADAGFSGITAIHNGTRYMFFFTAPNNRFATDEAEFLQMAQSWRWKS